MLKHMKRKGDVDRYTFGECCLFILMIIGAIFSLSGFLAAFILACARNSFSTLVWLIPCGVVAVVCCAGLIYIL